MLSERNDFILFVSLHITKALNLEEVHIKLRKYGAREKNNNLCYVLSHIWECNLCAEAGLLRKCCKIHDTEREGEGNDLLRHTLIRMENMRSEMYARNWAQGRLVRTKLQCEPHNPYSDASKLCEFMSITTYARNLSGSLSVLKIMGNCSACIVSESR